MLDPILRTEEAIATWVCLITSALPKLWETLDNRMTWIGDLRAKEEGWCQYWVSIDITLRKAGVTGGKETLWKTILEVYSTEFRMRLQILKINFKV